MLAISERYPLIAKVRATRVGTQNTTAFQYRGPELETVSIDSDTIFNLPDYRRKHLCFDYGKLLLGIPTRPESIPGLKTVRRNQVDQTQPWPIDTKHGFDLAKVTVADLSRFVYNPLKIQFYTEGKGHSASKWWLRWRFSQNGN